MVIGGGGIGLAVLCAASIMVCIQQASGSKCRLGAVVELDVSELALLLSPWYSSPSR